ncbi:unnamed protein product [marine sediment metagenome]|uniref:Uncharacterized protein n=1 Tax=marine sediment metagenome TaxID=412755 RepID=X1HQS5_9ZZZZ
MWQKKEIESGNLEFNHMVYRGEQFFLFFIFVHIPTYTHPEYKSYGYSNR